MIFAVDFSDSTPELVVARSIPMNLQGHGKSRDEALDNLRGLLRWIGSDGDSPEEEWRRGWMHSKKGDVALFAAAMNGDDDLLTLHIH